MRLLAVAAGLCAIFAAPAGAVWNGTSATVEAPWAVRVTASLPGKTLSCSGSIISRHFVLTAAHCLGTNMQVRGDFPSGTTMAAATVAWSGGWTCSTGGLDVALLQSTTDLSSLTPRPLPLAPSSALDAATAGSPVTYFGWGDTGDEAKVSWVTVPGECGGQAPSSVALSTSVQKTRDGAYIHDPSCPGDNISAQICFAKSGDVSRIGVGDSGGPWVAWYGGYWVELAVMHGTYDNAGSEEDATSVGVSRDEILSHVNGEVLQPAAQTIVRDASAGTAWLVGADGFRRSIPSDLDARCFQDVDHDPVVPAAPFEIQTIPEMVGAQATCTPAAVPDVSGGGGSGGGGSSGGGAGGGLPPDLHVDVAANATTSPPVGGELDYAITVSSKNAGGSSSVRLDVTLPAGYTVSRIQRDRGPGCTGTPPTLACDVGWINPSTSTHIWIFGNVGQGGAQDVTATATSLLEPELDPKDNVQTVRLVPSPTAAPVAFAPPPQALHAPKLTGVARVGTMLRSTPARWSAAPSSVSYRWQLCAGSRCTAITGATSPTLKVRRAYVGRSIRVVAIASFPGARLKSISGRVGVRPKA
jgi:hypothetical protein